MSPIGGHILPSAETIGQKLLECHSLISFVVHQIDKEIVVAEFPHDLAADPAGREGPGDNAVLSAADGDGSKIPVPIVDSFENGGALGAVGGAVGGVFDVAALIDGSVGTQQRRAYLVARIGNIRMRNELNNKNK